MPISPNKEKRIEIQRVRLLADLLELADSIENGENLKKENLISYIDKIIQQNLLYEPSYLYPEIHTNSKKGVDIYYEES